jgi:hypothetical protein
LRLQIQTAQKTIALQASDFATQESRLQQVLRDFEHAKAQLQMPIQDDRLHSVPLFMRLNYQLGILQTEVTRLKSQNQLYQQEQSERSVAVRQAIDSLRVRKVCCWSVCRLIGKFLLTHSLNHPPAVIVCFGGLNLNRSH